MSHKIKGRSFSALPSPNKDTAPMSIDALVNRLGSIFEYRYSNRIAFRSLSRSDAFPLFMATREAQFNAFLLWKTPEQEGETVAQVDKLIRENTMRRLLALSICERSTGTWWGYTVWKPFKDGAELSLYLHPCVWNTGVVFASGCAAIDIVMKSCPDMPIYTRVHQNNIKMRKICIGYGFEKTGTDTLTHGEGHEVVVDVFMLDKSRWPEVDVSKY